MTRIVRSVFFLIPYWHDGPINLDEQTQIPATQVPALRQGDEQVPAKDGAIDVSQNRPVNELGHVQLNETLVRLVVAEQKPPFRQIGLKQGFSDKTWWLIHILSMKNSRLLTKTTKCSYVLCWTHTNPINTRTSIQMSRQKRDSQYGKGMKISYSFIHRPEHGFKADVSQREPVNVPTQRQMNQVELEFHWGSQIPWFKHGIDWQGLPKMNSRNSSDDLNSTLNWSYFFHIDHR